MKNYIYIIASFCLICLSSCKKDESISFGTVEYYPNFLWVDSKTMPVTKTFDFDFSKDAKDKESYAEFQFVDNGGKAISTDIMQIKIDGKKCPNNRFRISSDVASKELTFEFSPNAPDGKHQGYLKLVNHELDRLDSQPLTANQQVDVFQWTLNYDKRMNPLAKVLMWICILLVAFIFVWFALIKPIMYPRIRLSRLELSSKKGYYVNKRINGARKVVVSNSRNKQSFLNKLFTGEILYIVNEIWTSPWDLYPKGRKRVVKINLHGKYMITPITSELVNYGEYQLTSIGTKESITIKII